jgi:hypothetical protein
MPSVKNRETMQMKTLLLKKGEVSRLICMKEVIGAVEEAYKAFNSDQDTFPITAWRN